MTKIPQIPASKGSNIGDFDLADCFFQSGELLYAAAYDGITKNAMGRIGFPADEFFHGHFIVAFYNFRHAIELKMKQVALLLEITKWHGHKLSDLWDEILKHPQIKSNETIVTEALLVLADYDVLQDEELFRYSQRNKFPNQLLQDYPAIQTESFHLLGKAYHSLSEAILLLTHESTCR